METWEDIERAAINDTVLYMCVTLYRQGRLTKEQALIKACLTLAKLRAEAMERELNRLMRGE